MMNQFFRLDLADIPWPISILKFKQTMDAMDPGDRLAVTLRDVDVVDNLSMIFRGRSDFEFRVQNAEGGYYFQAQRKSPPPVGNETKA